MTIFYPSIYLRHRPYQDNGRCLARGLSRVRERTPFKPLRVIPRSDEQPPKKNKHISNNRKNSIEYKNNDIKQVNKGI